MTVRERRYNKSRYNKIMSYLKNKYPEYTFISDVVLDKYLLIYCWTIKRHEKVNSYIFSLNIRLTKKRYKEIEMFLGLLKEVNNENNE